MVHMSMVVAWRALVPTIQVHVDVCQVEELFQVLQMKKAPEKQSAGKQLAILDLKRATAIGIRMAGLKCASTNPLPSPASCMLRVGSFRSALRQTP